MRTLRWPSGLIALAFAAAALGVSAHLEPGSLSSPKAGLAYAAGSQVTITWVQAEFHQGKYAFAYSRNGGSTWVSIADWNGPSGDHVTVKYLWTVPDAPGSATQVRVCQLGVCDDPDYVLVSGNFTINPVSAVKPPGSTGSAAGPSLRYLAASRSLEVSFSLDRGERVSLEAFDARGTRVAAWLDGVHAAGSHAYVLDSRLIRSGEPFALRLRVGHRTVARTFIPSP